MRKDLAKKSGFDEEFINDCCLSRPVEVVIEEIKKDIAHLIAELKKAYADNAKLKRENEKLKDELKRLKK